MNQGYYYLAGPHKGTPEEELYRYETSLRITNAFLKQGIYIFSPIVYGKHVTDAYTFASLEERRMIFMNYLLEFLRASKGMILLTMEGWDKSWGANQELIYCKNNQIPVYMMDPGVKDGDLATILANPLNAQELNQLLNAA
jgi:hypothetical protein